MTRQDIIESATSWMEKKAKNPEVGYDQDYRWGQNGDYDCSGAVITAWDKAGVDLKNDGKDNTGVWPKKGGANTTYDMGPVLEKNGFVDVKSKVNLKTGEGLKRGDILLRKSHHVAMYCGNGKEVEASINEHGTAHGGQPGDQTGREFLIRSYRRDYHWTNVYRSEGGVDEKVDKKPVKAKATFNDHTNLKVTAHNGLNIRKAPVNGQIITAIPFGSLVSYDDDRDKEGTWFPVDKYKVAGQSEWKKIKGYCSSKFLKEV